MLNRYIKNNWIEILLLRYSHGTIYVWNRDREVFIAHLCRRSSCYFFSFFCLYNINFQIITNFFLHPTPLTVTSLWLTVMVPSTFFLIFHCISNEFVLDFLLYSRFFNTFNFFRYSCRHICVSLLLTFLILILFWPDYQAIIMDYIFTYSWRRDLLRQLHSSCHVVWISLNLKGQYETFIPVRLFYILWIV